MSARNDVLAEAAALLHDMAPHEVLLWSGAGLSVEGPTSLPGGPDLTRRVFDAFFEDGALARVLTYHQVVGLHTSPLCALDTTLPTARLPRLETALDAAARARSEAFPDTFDILDDVRNAVPNRLHHFAARHIALGGRHTTANFDTCVERAYELQHDETVPHDAVHHFHGSFADSPDGKDLGATLSRIESGFPPREADTLTGLLRRHRAVIVIGYSGSDYFDVDRMVAALAPNGLQGLRVLWVMHANHRAHVPEAPPVPLQSLLRAAGAGVHVVCGPTDALLTEIARGWGLPPLAAPRPRSPQEPHLVVTAAERHRATFLLYRALGMHREVGRLLRSGGTGADDPVELRSVRSQLLWEAGAWNSLRRMWWRAPADEPDQHTRNERIGACLWAQGRLLPAWWWLNGQRAAVEGNPQAAYALEETISRVVEHMHRTPDLRAIGRRLLERIPSDPPVVTASGDDDHDRHEAAFRALTDVRDSLDALRRGAPRAHDDHARESTTWFRESGDLQGMLSYRHRALRDAYGSGETEPSDAELRERYDELRTANLFLGSPAGAYRTVLLPGAHRVYRLHEFVFGLMALQYGWWHRFRLLAWYLPRRLRHWSTTRRRGVAGVPGEPDHVTRGRAR